MRSPSFCLFDVASSVDGRTYVDVEALGLDNVVVDYRNVETALIFGRKILDQLVQRWPADTVGTVHCQTARRLLSLECRLESRTELLVVALLRWLTVGILGAFGVQAPHHVM